MILYSIIPAEIVFGNTENASKYNFFEIDYMGEKVQVSPVTGNQLVINRIISTSPKAYLDPKLQPGTIISGGLQGM